MVPTPESQLISTYGDLSTKMDELIRGQEHIDARLSALEERVDESLAGVECKVDELYRTVRGFNGTPGLVTQVALVADAVDKIQQRNDKADGVHAFLMKDAGDKDATEQAKVDDSKVITWKYVVEKFFVPVGMAFLIWFLLTLLPNILEHLGNP